MSTTGEVLPTSGTSTSEAPWSDNGWTSPENVTANDATYASVTATTFDAGDQTFVLKAQGCDFSGIPAGATIDGVTVRVEARGDSTSVFIDLVQLLDTTGAKVGTNLAAAPSNDVALTTSDAVYTFGGATELWGNSLTDTWVKDADFGVAIGVRADVANSQVFVDYVTIEINYTAGGGGGAPVHESSGLQAIASGRTTAAIPVPSGVENLDIIVVQVYKESTAAFDSLASGFVEKSQLDTTDPVEHTIFWKRASGNDSGTYDFTWTGAVWAGGSAHRISGAVTSGDPFDDFDHQENASDSNNSPAVSGTTTVDDTLLLWLTTGFGGSSSWTPPTGFTEVFENVNLTAAWKAQAAAGSTGSISGSSTNADLKMSFLGAIKPASGLTAVGKDNQLVWDTRAAVGDTAQLVWDTKAAVGDTVELVWDVLTSVGDPLELQWKVRQAVGQQVQALWDVRAAAGDNLQLVWDIRAAVGDNAQLVWDTRALVADDSQLVWNVRETVGDPLELQWNVRAAVGDPLQLIWNVASALTAVGKNLELLWNVRAALGDPLGLVWHTRAAVGDPLALQWNTLTTVGDQIELPWNVRTSVGDEVQLVWDVRAAVGDPLQLIWDTLALAAVGKDLQLIWNVVGSNIPTAALADVVKGGIFGWDQSVGLWRAVTLDSTGAIKTQ